MSLLATMDGAGEPLDPDPINRESAELMEAALRKAGVPVKLIRIAGGDHGPTFPGATNPPDYKVEMVKWFDEYLRRPAPGQ